MIRWPIFFGVSSEEPRESRLQKQSLREISVRDSKMGFIPAVLIIKILGVSLSQASHGEMQIIPKGVWTYSLLVWNVEEKAIEITLPRAKEGCPSVKAFKSRIP